MNPGAAVGLLAGYNVVQNTLLRDRGYVAGNLAATALGLAWARRDGLDLSEAGLGFERLGRGFIFGLGVAIPLAVAARAVRHHPVLGALLDDRRLWDADRKEARYRVTVRFPLGTALFEEVWFRGILPAVFRRHAVARPELASAAVFTAWHLIPTAAAVSANHKASSLSRSGKTAAVVGGSIAAGIAGLGFTALRHLSGSLAAPWLVHATANGSAYLASLQLVRGAETPAHRGVSRIGSFPDVQIWLPAKECPAWTLHQSTTAKRHAASRRRSLPT